MPTTRPIILCPLHVERRALLAGWSGDAVEVSCCGPGHEGIARWAGAYRRLDRPVILAGPRALALSFSLPQLEQKRAAANESEFFIPWPFFS